MKLNIELRYDLSEGESKRSGPKECRMCAKDDPIHPLDGILEGLAESIAREEPEELLHEAQAAGRDTKTIADKMRNAAAAVLKEFEQRKLSAARQTWQERS